MFVNNITEKSLDNWPICYPAIRNGTA